MAQRKKMVITGGAGFIGSHLAEKLAGQDYQVIILDNLSTGKIQNIEPLLKKENVEFIEDSITNLPLLQKLFQDVRFVFHLAAVTSVPQSIEQPLFTTEINITGTLNVLLASRDNNVRKVIYASSSAVYGDAPTFPKEENMLPTPESPYAVSKMAGEYYCQVFQNVWGLDTVCLRYFNIYGPRQDSNSPYAAVIPRFIQMVSQGSPPVIFGDGEQTRDFAFISDVTAANILAAESQATGIFNIGRGQSTTIEQLARLSIKLVGNDTDMEPIHTEPRPGDVKHSLADIARAGSFGYNPRYNLEEGLRKTVKAFQLGRFQPESN